MHGNLRKMFCKAAVLGAYLVGASNLASAQALAGGVLAANGEPNDGPQPRGAATITAVTPVYPALGSQSSQQYIVIEGSGFGSTPAQLVALGDGSYDTYACNVSTPSLAIWNKGSGPDSWAAGRETCSNEDLIGIIPDQNLGWWWSDNVIVLWGFGAALDGVNYNIAKHDPLVVNIFKPNGKRLAHFRLKVSPMKPKRQAGDTLVTVPGNAGMVDTGISVQSGQTVSINAAGLVTIATDSRPPFSPAGFLANCSVYAPGGNGFPAPQLSCESLIGQIGTGGQIFEVGASQAFMASQSGELYLGINDNILGDNSGSWKASVLVE